MEDKESRESFIGLMAKFMGYGGKRLADGVIAKLKELNKKEKPPIGRVIYDAMSTDLKMAVELDRPCCQDTGVLQFFVQVGTKFPLIDDIEACLAGAVKIATVNAQL